MTLLDIIGTRLAARPDAACYGLDPEAWFSDNGQHQAAAARVCKTCPHELACLGEALEAERGLGVSSRFGVWGGLGPTDRARLDPTAPGVA